MINVSPWISSRKRVILFIIFDYILFSSILSIFRIEDGYVRNLEFFFQQIVVIFWIFFNYLIENYTLDNLKNITKYFFCFIRNFTFSLLYIVFLSIFDFIPINYQSIKFFLLILIYSLSTIFIKILILKFIEKNFYKSNEIYVLSQNEDFFKDLNVFNKYSRINSKLIRFNFVQNSFSHINSFSTLVVKEFSFLNDFEKKLVLLLRAKKIKVIDAITWCEVYLQRIPSSLLKKFDLIDLYNFDNLSYQFKFIKRSGDILISSFLLIIFSPLILFSCFLIFLEDFSPPFYSQERVGFKGKIFKLYKLRTMDINAEKEGIRWSLAKDSRVTKIGSILRKTRIDELPQLICVLKGEMSLIGPRPERPYFDSKLIQSIPFYKMRYKTKPGISGWAQVNYSYGASISDSENKLSYDLFYLRNISFLLDFLIFLKTIKLVFNLKGSVPGVKYN